MSLQLLAHGSPECTCEHHDIKLLNTDCFRRRRSTSFAMEYREEYPRRCGASSNVEAALEQHLLSQLRQQEHSNLLRWKRWYGHSTWHRNVRAPAFNRLSLIILIVFSGDCVDVFYHTKPVYGLGVDPSNDNIFATAGEDGRVLLFDLRSSNDEPTVVVKYRAPFHSVMFHPVDEHFMITANAKEGAALWDNRAQRMPIIRYGGDDAAQSCMSVRFNSMGTHLLALRRRLPPILYSTLHQDPICQFYNQDYYNSCTMKSCTFAGANDEFVLSGSDDFNLYVWKVSDADRELKCLLMLWSLLLSFLF